MKKICLVGAGHISRVYAGVLAPLEYEVHYVDPRFGDLERERCYASVEAVPAALREAFRFWIICVPTAEHVAVLAHVLECCPEARVLIEKPITPMPHFPQLMELSARYPACRILENGQYEHSTLVDKILATLPEIAGRKAAIRSVYVEFTKNRIQDNRRGRFRDEDYSLVGYEGPHLVACADAFVSRLFGESILDPAATLACIDKNVNDPSAPDEGSGRFTIQAPGLPPVQLYTSTIGEVGGSAVMPKTYPQVHSKWIFARDPERYRIVRLNFDDYSLVFRFDPQRIFSGGLLRNNQILYRLKGKEVERLKTLSFDIFADAISSNLKRLEGAEFDTRESLETSRHKAELLHRLAEAYVSASPRATSLDENRREWRVDVLFQVTLSVGGEEFVGRVTDISEKGFQFECQDVLPVAAPVSFRMGVEKGPVRFQGAGRIRWARHFNFESEGIFCYGAAVDTWEGRSGPDIVKDLLLE